MFLDYPLNDPIQKTFIISPFTASSIFSLLFFMSFWRMYFVNRNIFLTANFTGKSIFLLVVYFFLTFSKYDPISFGYSFLQNIFLSSSSWNLSLDDGKLLFPKNKYGEPIYGIGKRSLLAAYFHLNIGTFPSYNRSFKDTKIKLYITN